MGIMGDTGTAMQSGNEPGAPDIEDAEEDRQEEKEESPMVYLTKEQLGTDCKVGDTVTLKATDIDPETGEVAFEVQDWEKGGSETKPGSYEQAFDEAVPAEGAQGGA